MRSCSRCARRACPAPFPALHRLHFLLEFGSMAGMRLAELATTSIDVRSEKARSHHELQAAFNAP